jgi:DNA phosphorothioation-dependent restriction protein DptG
MTDVEAVRKLVFGQMLTHEEWEDDEFIVMNRHGEIQMEDGTHYELDKKNGWTLYIRPKDVLRNSVSTLGQAMMPHGRSKFTEYEREIIKKINDLGISKTSIKEMTNVSSRSLARIVNEKN